MKATIEVPDDLYRRVKAEAALRGLTVREVTTDLYRRWLGEDAAAAGSPDPAAWLDDWLATADRTLVHAPLREGSAREILEQDRNRLGS